MECKIYIIGTGPGGHEYLSIAADKALKEAGTIIGYKLYIELIKGYYPGKEFMYTGMKQEAGRCRMAFGEALKGKKVAMVCSGDAGVYGMAGLMYELSKDYPGVKLEVIPGITAALSGGAMLGAPVSHDFAVISLSDLMTSWDTIEKRLAYAAEGDFVICIYNPSSQKRQDYLQKACDIILKYKKEDTVCGIAKNIARKGSSIKIMPLKELRDTQTDMFTTVFIGNSGTTVIDGHMVTPRGYILHNGGNDEKV